MSNNGRSDEILDRALNKPLPSPGTSVDPLGTVNSVVGLPNLGLYDSTIPRFRALHHAL